MICLKRRVWILPLAAVMALAGCTSVDDLLGNNLIPEDQQMQTLAVTLGEDPATEPVYFETRLYQVDTIQTSDMRNVYIGSRFTPDFGYTVCSGIIQPLPDIDATATDATNNYFGAGAIFDSVYFRVKIPATSGNTMPAQDFTIYEVTKDLKRDSTYYNLSNIGTYYDASKPLFRFTSDLAKNDTVSFKVYADELTPDGKDYIDRLIATGSNFESDKVFILGNGGTFAGFKGLVFVPDNKMDAALYKVDLSGTSYFTLYTHHPEVDTGGTTTNKQVTASYPFTDYYYYAMSVFHVEHDYASGTFSSQISHDLKVQGPLVETAYVEAMSGVFTELTVTDALLDRIRQLGGGKNIAINNASICFDLADNSVAAMNKALNRIGMYLNYPQMYSYLLDMKNITNPNIPDYNPYYENTYSTTTAYGGYLTRSSDINVSSFYSMDITSTIHKLLQDASYQRTISLGADQYYPYAFGQVSLKGSQTPNYRIKLKLTYTLIP